MNILQYNGINIAQRKDGYVNLTQMCKVNGKRLDVYLKSEKTKEYIEQLNEELNYHRLVVVNPVRLLEVKEGRGGGAWGHPLLTLNLARWTAEFTVWCNSRIFILMTTGKTDLGIDPLQTTMRLMPAF